MSYFHEDGRLAESPVTVARWLSTRGTATLADAPANFTPPMAQNLLGELSIDEPEPERRSATLTLLSQLMRIPETAEAAAQKIFALIDHEKLAPLRAHAILLLSRQRPKDARVEKLVSGLLRTAPPYSELAGPWRFAMCSAEEFHEGACDCLVNLGFKKVDSPSEKYQVLQAPFHNPGGEVIQIWARAAEVEDEDQEMGDPQMVGLLINRHAQLGIFDLLAAQTRVEQRGYKLLMNSQCCGLTTRWIVARSFPDADLYSSWDSTHYHTHAKKVSGDEGIDCFVALLQGMAKGESHAQLQARIAAAQWDHGQANFPGFTQFVGPAHPLVLERFSDLDGDGHADLSEDFLDFDLKPMRELFGAALAPRDPHCAPSQVGGEAASGLQWAAGSLDRVTKYSEIWWQLPGKSESRYVFSAGGFYDQDHPPADGAGALPAFCRYQGSGDSLTCEVMFHSWLSHCPRELKRLLCAAEALNQAVDLGHLALPTPFARRGALLLMMMGLLEFPSDPNHLDAIWGLALQALQLPPVSRAVVRSCISEDDHEKRDDYYGAFSDLTQLKTVMGRTDPLALKQLESDDREIGRARPLRF